MRAQIITIAELRERRRRRLEMEARQVREDAWKRERSERLRHILGDYDGFPGGGAA